MVGGEYVARNLSLLAEDGRLVQIAVLQGSKATVDAALLMRRRLTFTGSTLRPRPVVEKARIAAALDHGTSVCEDATSRVREDRVDLRCGPGPSN